jgi:glycosyltransferase involved in cell wall biosynthesis
MARSRRVLILVENLSVPFDRRVWQEAQALTGAGYHVEVICPQGKTCDRERHVVLEGIHIHRYPLREATGGGLDYLREYSVALWRTLVLALRLGWRTPFDAVHACNPPDLLFLVALVLRLRGTRFVFDHHDLVPELYRSREGRQSPLVHRALLALERLTFRTADLVLSTNESYRTIAIRRGRVPAERVHVVRSAPDLGRFVQGIPDQSLRRGRRHLVVYLGVMGPQDGVDHALRALAHLRDDLGRDDVHAVFIGAGPSFDDCVALADRLQLDDVVEFTGRIPDADLARYLATADLGLAPDPFNPLNDLSSMNKVVEYLAMGVPVVAFDLVEMRVSGGDAGWYSPIDDDRAFAAGIDALLADVERRRRMTREGRRRVREELSWDISRRNLLAAYASLLGPSPLDLRDLEEVPATVLAEAAAASPVETPAPASIGRRAG